MAKIIVGVMGPGDSASEEDCRNARELGRRIALEGWAVLSGGLSVGVMDAVSRGAKEAGGLVIGVLPTADRQGASPAVDIPIVTGMGSGRNNINALTSDLVIACGMSAGTASEIALAVRAGKAVILLTSDEPAIRFFQSLDPKKVFPAKDPAEAIEIA
ncbi:MAG TPA: cytochrome [Nitrospiria bacterium]|nr:cytochrome [Nitrospiria bacterium]